MQNTNELENASPDANVAEDLEKGSWRQIEVCNDPAATALGIAYELVRLTAKDGHLDFLTARNYADHIGELAGRVILAMRSTAGVRVHSIATGGGNSKERKWMDDCAGKMPCAGCQGCRDYSK